jgi:hypothetical protein
MKNESEKNTSLPVQVLRWAVVLPGSIIAALIAMFPIHWIVLWLHMKNSEGDNGFLAIIPEEMMERFLYAFCTPFVMIAAGMYIAPKLKYQTGIGLAVLWGVLFGASVVMTIGQYEGWNWLRFGITVVLGVAGVIAGLYQINQPKIQNS